MDNDREFNTDVSIFPLFFTGEVINGFGRGSRQLGIPTANYSSNVVNKLPPELETGVYFGWAQVDDGEIHKMVMSIGWNPYYKNEKKSMETHILHKFNDDFYGSNLKTCIVDYIRPEKDFASLDELIKTIRADIKLANQKLSSSEYEQYKEDDFFTGNKGIRTTVNKVLKASKNVNLDLSDDDDEDEINENNDDDSNDLNNKKGS
ncbi:riboflavin kinase isoform X2 [Lycorma delicatula]|uniref:riboflavin kinase isoform X2 n=1 Tax=Lycorma delicatula TaxID=130591 RepID=UPI003F50E662